MNGSGHLTSFQAPGGSQRVLMACKLPCKPPCKHPNQRSGRTPSK